MNKSEGPIAAGLLPDANCDKHGAEGKVRAGALPAEAALAELMRRVWRSEEEARLATDAARRLRRLFDIYTYDGRDAAVLAILLDVLPGEPIEGLPAGND